MSKMFCPVPGSPIAGSPTAKRENPAAFSESQSASAEASFIGSYSAVSLAWWSPE